MDETGRTTARGTRLASRRDLLRCAAAIVPALTTTASLCSHAVADECEEPVASQGRLKQSIAHWCFAKYWDVEKTCQVARELGCVSVELVDPEHWPTLKRYGLVCALASSHWFEKGMNNPKYQEMCLAKLRQAIDACSDFGFPNVITFTGLAEGITPDEGLEHCVAGYKKIVGYAEKKKVNICLEMLNSRVPIEMVGVPGYQGDHTDYCMNIIQRVGSPRMKLLFDIFHVQIMDGDIISRIRQYKDYIGHYHTAGNPGRHELDETQEINYRPIMEAIADTGFSGYVGHEFMPTRDPLQGLREAVAHCTA